LAVLVDRSSSLIRMFLRIMSSLSLLSDCADTGFAAAFAVLSSSSRRRMIGRRHTLFFVRLFAICKLLLQSVDLLAQARIRFLPISYGARKIIIWLWLTQRFKVACSLEIIKCCNRCW
ncbi:hypothetical protein KCU75_g27, partial [Aureobasidium melanogenum]